MQEKNKEHRPQNWKDTCKEANNDSTAIKAALVDDTLRRTADTLPLVPGHWQNDIVVEEGNTDRTSRFICVHNRNKLDLWTITLIPYIMN